MESDKNKQSVIQIVRNKIYGNNISKIRLNQEVDGRIFGIKNDEIVCISDENATEVSFDKNFQKILFGNYYRVVKKIGNKVTAECKNCKSIMKDLVVTCHSTRRHLKVCSILICDLNGFIFELYFETRYSMPNCTKNTKRRFNSLNFVKLNKSNKSNQRMEITSTSNSKGTIKFLFKIIFKFYQKKERS